jgi:hypothetical protein
MFSVFPLVFRRFFFIRKEIIILHGLRLFALMGISKKIIVICRGLGLLVLIGICSRGLRLDLVIR